MKFVAEKEKTAQVKKFLKHKFGEYSFRHVSGWLHEDGTIQVRAEQNECIHVIITFDMLCEMSECLGTKLIDLTSSTGEMGYSEMTPPENGYFNLLITWKNK